MRKRITNIAGHLTQDPPLNNCLSLERAGDAGVPGGAQKRHKIRKTVGSDTNGDLGNGPDMYGSRRERHGEVVRVTVAIGELGVIGRDSVEARLHLRGLELLRFNLQRKVQSLRKNPC